jgi:hypothetical protein
MAMQDNQSVAADETSTLISSDKVEGTAVYNREGEKLGSIHTLMIDKMSGKVAYAVMSFGGFLGIGDRYHPLPWDVLTYDTGQGGYVVDRDRSMLTRTPGAKGAPRTLGGKDADQNTKSQSNLSDYGSQEDQPRAPKAAATVQGIGGRGRPRSLAQGSGGEEGMGLH